MPALAEPSRPDDQHRVRPLDAPVVVLALPRSGSSLLMQTLALLGAPVIGERWLKEYPRSANPRGYFEDIRLSVHGLTEENLERLGDRLFHSAWKRASHRLVMRPEPGEWRRLVDARATLLVSMRHPVESALSWRALNLERSGATEPAGRDGFVSTTRLLLRDLGAFSERQFRLAEWLTGEASGLADRSRFVPYEFHGQPRRYVDLVCRYADLTPGSERIEQAVANVTPRLHRKRSSAVPEAWLRLYERLPARPVFELVNRPDIPHVWSRLLRLRERLSN